jgi:STE24 endopeptidase
MNADNNPRLSSYRRSSAFIGGCFLCLFLSGVLHAQAPASTQREYKLSPEKRDQAIQFARAKYTLHFVEAGWGLLVLVGLLELGWAARTRTLAEAASRRAIVQGLVFAPLITLLTDVPMLPTEAYLQHLELKYGQSVQGWASWLWDWVKGEFLGIIMGAIFVLIFFGMIRFSPRRWWLWCWGVSLPLIAFTVFIAPVVIDPMFHKFTPLAAKHPDLVTEIQKVTRRGGLDIPSDRVFEMDASEKVTSINAYVTGFGATKRVVVWDTTIARCTTPDILFTFGHEQGHYVLNHVPKTMVFLSALLLIALYAGYRCMGWLLERRGSRWGLRGQEDWAAYVVLVLLISAFSFVAEPITSAWSRFQEHQADVYGLEVIHGLVPDSQTVAADSFQLLGEVALSDPDPPPFIEFWLYSHPSIGERVRFAQSYDPWGAGKSPEFVK